MDLAGLRPSFNLTIDKHRVNGGLSGLPIDLVLLLKRSPPSPYRLIPPGINIHGTASRLRPVIDGIALKKGGIPRWGIRSRFTPIKEMEGQEGMIVDTRPVRRIGKRSNQGKFGKQPNGTLSPVAMSPTNPQC